MFDDLPKNLLEDIETILDPETKDIEEEDAVDSDEKQTSAVNKSQLNPDKNHQNLGEEDEEDSEKEEAEDEDKLKAGSSEELAAGQEPNDSGEPVGEEDENPFKDKSDEELVNDWNLLTDVSNNIKEDDYKPTDKLEALKNEIDRRQLIQNGAQIGKRILKKKNVTENVDLVPLGNEGEYNIVGSTSKELLGKVITSVYGTIVTDTIGRAIPGIPKVSRDYSLADIKKALDAQFLTENVENIDDLKKTLQQLSDDELVQMWNQLTFTKKAVSDDLELDKTKISLIRDILTDRMVVKGGIEDGKFINPINVEKF